MGENFAAAKVDVLERRDVAKKLGVVWTPTILALAPDGTPLHQTIGWLSPQDFQVEFGYALGRAALASKDFEKATRLLREAVGRAPKHDRGPEALYWCGVSEYRRTGGIDGAKAVWRELAERYPESAYAGRVRWML